MPVDVARFLQPGEATIRVERRVPLSAVDSAVGMLLLAAAAITGLYFLAAQAPPFAPFFPGIAAAIAALALAGLVALAVRVATSVNIVTADRVYHAHGRLRFYLAQTTYDRVTDLHVRQSLVGRFAGFGTVRIQTAGAGVTFTGVRDPFGLKNAIEDAREDMVRRLVGEHRQAQARTTAPVMASTGAAVPAPALAAKKAPRSRKTAAAGPESVAVLAVEAGPATPTPAAPTRPARGPARWTAAPTVASMVASIIPTILFLGIFSLTSLSALAAGKPGMAILLVIGVAVAIGLVVLSMVIRFRTTRYEVHGWGVAVSRGWLSRRRVEARFEKVTDVTVTQGLLGRLFGFGTIRINTAGGADAPIVFAGVPDPDRVKAIVDEARGGP